MLGWRDRIWFCRQSAARLYAAANNSHVLAEVLRASDEMVRVRFTRPAGAGATLRLRALPSCSGWPEERSAEVPGLLPLDGRRRLL